MRSMIPKPLSVSFFYDRWIMTLTAILILFGLLMVTSASMVISDKLYHYPFHYLLRQLFFLMTGLLIAWVIAGIPLVFWQKMSRVLMLLCIFILLLVFLPIIGRAVNGSHRWMHLGFVSLQVSEAVKLMSILYLAGYLQNHLQEVRAQLSGFIKPMLFLMIMGILLLAEPDFGATAVIAITFLAVLFVAGARLWPFLAMFLSALSLLTIVAVTSPYRMQRLTTFLDPWLHAYSSGYQLTQSLIAFGRGGFFGVGLGNSVQKLFYLPEAHTDFIFAVIGEELGLIGELLLITLFVLLIVRILYLGKQALQREMYFSGFAAIGIGFWLGFQSMINLGVNVGMLPTKGLTLPFVSYGGSSLWMSCAAMGIVLRIAYEIQTSTPTRFRNSLS